MRDFDDDDEVVVVGQTLPRIATASALDERRIFVSWHAGDRAKEREVVDLGAVLARFKLYAPLRDDDALFGTVRAQEHGYGVAWGDGSIDMGSVTIAEAADETMTAEDFSAFMERHSFTLDRVAAELGISRRMAAYYKKQARVPRTVALACRYLDKASAMARPADGETTTDVVRQLVAQIVDTDARYRLRPDVRWNLDRLRAALEEKAAAALHEANEAVLGMTLVKPPIRHG